MGALSLVPPGVLVIVTAVVMSLTSRRRGHLLGIITTGVVIPWVLFVPTGQYLVTEFVGFRIVLFNVDQASRFMGFIYGLIALVTIVYAYASERSTFQTGLGLAYAGTGLGAVFAGDWFTLLVFWELMSVASVFLIWNSGGPAIRAGFRYAVFHGISGLFFVLAVILQYVETGSFLFTAHDGMVAGLPALLAVLAIGTNAGFVALHTWLPDSYPKAHFVVSVVLCGYTTKTAVYALYRAFPDGHLFVAYMGGVMALFGVTFALLQTDMRRLLSYHIQSQVGYMVAGIGIGSALGIAGGFAHLFNNILYKSLLFMVAGVILYRTGYKDLKKLGGLYRVMPVTFIVFLIAAVSIVGVPGFNGFVSKAMVKSAAKKEHLEVLKWMFTIAGVGTAMSFAKFGYYAFVREKHGQSGSDSNLGQSVAMGIIAVLCIVYGLYPNALFSILPGIDGATPRPYSVDSMGEAALLTVIGIAGFVFVRKPLGAVTPTPDLDRLYNPIAFYGLRAIVVTAATVGMVVNTGLGTVVAAAQPIVADPQRTLAHLDRIWPDVDYRPSRADLQTSIAIIFTLTAVLLVLFLLGF